MNNRDIKTLGEYGEMMNDVVNHLYSLVIPGYPMFQLASEKLKRAKTLPQLMEGWASFVSDCKNQMQKGGEGSARMQLLIRAIANNTHLANTFSHIKTLDDLVIAQQKSDFLTNHLLPAILRLEGERGKLGVDLIAIQRKLAAYQSLQEQIIASDTKTTLEEILKEDSLFLNAKLKSKEQLPGVVFSESDSIQSVLTAKRPRLFSWFVSAEESDSKMMLDKVRDELIDPRTVLSVGEFPQTADKSEAFAANKKLLLNLEAGFKGQRKTLEIQRLINDVVFFLYHSKDHEENHRLMINRIEAALAKEERHFRKSGFFKKSHIDFEKKLNGNDKKYWYPRLLRNLTSILLDPLQLNESDLTAVLLTINRGQKIKRELPVRTNEGPLKINHLNVYFTRSIQAGDVAKIEKTIATDYFEEVELKKRTYYISPEKVLDAQNKKITQRIGKGSFAYVKDAGVKVKLYQDKDLKISKHKWVEKNINQGTLQETRNEVEAIKDVAPDLRPNSILLKSHSKKGDNRHKFFMKNAGEWDLMDVILGKKIDFSANDILYIFQQLAAQISLAAANDRVMLDIKLENTLIDPATKKVTIVDHGNSPKIQQLGKKGGGIGVTLAYMPRDMRIGNPWMVYQVGLIMGLLIAPKSFAKGFDGRYQLAKPKVLEAAGEEKGIPAELIQLIKSMIDIHKKRSTLEEVNHVLNQYKLIETFTLPQLIR